MVIKSRCWKVDLPKPKEKSRKVETLPHAYVTFRQRGKYPSLLEMTILVLTIWWVIIIRALHEIPGISHQTRGTYCHLSDYIVFDTCDL